VARDDDSNAPPQTAVWCAVRRAPVLDDRDLPPLARDNALRTVRTWRTAAYQAVAIRTIASVQFWWRLLDGAVDGEHTPPLKNAWQRLPIDAPRGRLLHACELHIDAEGATLYAVCRYSDPAQSPIVVLAHLPRLLAVAARSSAPATPWIAHREARFSLGGDYDVRHCAVAWLPGADAARLRVFAPVRADPSHPALVPAAAPPGFDDDRGRRRCCARRYKPVTGVSALAARGRDGGCWLAVVRLRTAQLPETVCDIVAVDADRVPQAGTHRRLRFHVTGERGRDEFAHIGQIECCGVPCDVAAARRQLAATAPALGCLPAALVALVVAYVRDDSFACV
jgi:hypothetical protein